MTTNLLLAIAENPEQAAFYVILRIFSGFVCLLLIGAMVFLARNSARVFGAGPLTSGESHSSRRYIKFGVFAVLFHLALISAVMALCLH